MRAPIPKNENPPIVVVLKNSPLPIEFIVIRTVDQRQRRIAIKDREIAGKIAAIRISPDQKSLAILSHLPFKDGVDVAGRIRPKCVIMILPLDEGQTKLKTLAVSPLGVSAVSWKDSQTLIFSEIDAAKIEQADDDQPLSFVSKELSIESGQSSKLAIPPTHMVVDVSRDGKHVLTQVRPAGSLKSHNLKSKGFVVELVAGKIQSESLANFQPLRLSLNGQSAIGITQGDDKRILVSHEWAAAKITNLKDVVGSLDRLLLPHASYDGSRVVLGIHETYDMKNQLVRSFRYRIMTSDTQAIDRKSYFETDANETIGAFDIR